MPLHVLHKLHEARGAVAVVHGGERRGALPSWLARRARHVEHRLELESKHRRSRDLGLELGVGGGA